MRIIKKIIIIIALVLTASIFIMNVCYMPTVGNGWEEKVTINNLGIINLAICIILAIGILSISKWLDNKANCSKVKVKKYIFIGILFFIYVIIQIIWINTRDSYPIADSMRVYEASCEIYEGENITAIKYFELYPQNLSLAFIFSKIFMICNSSNLIIVKIINVIANCFTILGMYLILNLLKQKYEVNETLFGIVSFTYLPIMLLVNFIYGDLVSLPFTVFSLYNAMLYVNKKQKKYLIISSVLIMISIILRMNNLIFVIAIIIYLGIDLLETKKEKINEKKKIIQFITRIIFIILFIIISIIPSNILKSILKNRYNLNNKNSFPVTGFFAMGMQEGMRQNGWYNNNADIGWNETETANEQYIKQIKERASEFINNPLYAIKFYAIKTISMWAEPLQESIWQNLSFNFEDSKMKEKTDEQLSKYHEIDQKLINNQEKAELYQKTLILIIFGITTAIIVKNRKSISNEALLLLICFIGGLIFHTLWEAKSRYIISYIIVLIPLSSIKLNTKMEEKEENEKSINSNTDVL